MSGGTKYDQGKPRMGLLPSVSLEEVAKVLTAGAAKYSAFNWMKGIEFDRLYDAAQRHLTAWNKGQDVDPETKITHLAHASCCILFLIWMQKFRPDLDNRGKDPDTIQSPIEDEYTATTVLKPFTTPEEEFKEWAEGRKPTFGGGLTSEQIHELYNPKK